MPNAIKCPYCRTNIEMTPAPPYATTKANYQLCPHCHKPIAVYASRAEMMLHSDRSVKAIVVERARPDQHQTPWLEVIENQFTIHQELIIPEGVSILGRHNKDTTATLTITTADPSVGRHHLKLIYRNGRLSAQDNQSNTGTFLNGSLLGSGEIVHLSEGDVLSLGALSIIVHGV